MSHITFIPKDAPRLGDYARLGANDGRIYKIDHGPTESEDWLKLNKITDDEREEMWLSMLVYPAGAVTGPASRFTKLDDDSIPNFHEQRDAADYFSDCTQGAVYMDRTKIEDPFKV